ncbi:mandelate racemase/muconate lactonizing enzyme family protein [Tamlana sp. 2_MG-2023]|uniref:Mandelate racemase/muconate lactonizing enzyme family protein n=1 Tax=Pseudotamlana agarivorans TaxID=481183 RepID=A0ACC5U9K2_9FLAO|nr:MULTISPECIES: mandelate racemase/muconate lactonizing enzyme family protein [Tamlana]MBU2950987.1 mandelate racemase/muconate lactonizing enzyme family protein [Tamlana agarivorans]MDO6761223.1 mandelate racemase/muconate lactonizing enzyme family protein [Tamlana sp. 2_MG-2023]MDO6791706.1 mandelate racemase/muconate lactonizing enzyme family protein [Tamlana sp. 1_MG-2023]
MVIEKIETFILKDKLSKSFFFSQWEYSERCICVVKVTASDGTYGWGEGYGPATVLEAGIKLLAPFVIGENALQNEVVWNKMYRKTLDFARRGILVASMSAIDIAIWDLKGKILGLPVSTLLGGAHRNRVQPYATGLYFTDHSNPSKDFEEEAKLYISQGFKAMKMKVGLGIKADVENVAKMRNVIGPDIKLMVDSNHAYTLREATELARKIEQYDIGWFEEPLSPEFYEQYSELRQKTSIPISGGECEYLRFGFQQLIQNKSVDIIQPDICASGGLTEAKRISAIASANGVDIVPHTWGTSIGIHVALHFISNIESVPGRMYQPDFLMEYDQTENGLREKLTFPSIEMKDGFIAVPDRPGLGIDVNEDVLKEFSEK